jgi:hypothetical protein
MKISAWFLTTLFVVSNVVYSQKPNWVDNPGVYAFENFVSIGIAKDSKLDKARSKAEKKAKKGIEKILKNKYQDKEIKAAMSSLKFEAYWEDPATKYHYCLALLPIESIDKKYASEKGLQKAKSSAMEAYKMLNQQTKDPDVIIVKIEDDNEGLDGETESVAKDNTVITFDNKTEKATVTKIETSDNVIDIKNKSLGNFKWQDQNNDSKYSFLGEKLVVTVVAQEDLIPEEDNKNAPRIELSDVKGDFTIEVKASTDWSKYYSTGFGIIAHNGKNNVRTHFYYNGQYAYMKGFANDVALPESNTSFQQLTGIGYLKLVKKGYTFTAYYSSIANDWIQIGSFETEFSDNYNVGIYFINNEGTSVQYNVESAVVKQ